jgi:excisionase family DNA binding protein
LKAKPKETEDYLSLKEASEMFRVPLRQVKLAIKNGKLTAALVGRTHVVRRVAVNDWLKRQEEET